MQYLFTFAAFVIKSTINETSPNRGLILYHSTGVVDTFPTKDFLSLLITNNE